jgi:hypothetical protein
MTRRRNMHHTCPGDNLDYSSAMKKLCAWLLLAVLVLGVAGCKTSSGSRDYIPGKGWIHND